MEVVIAPVLAARRARDEAETRAVTAEAELKHLKLHSSKELQQAQEDLRERLDQAQAVAEQRVEEHTEDYRLQASQAYSARLTSQAVSHRLENPAALLSPWF